MPRPPVFSREAVHTRLTEEDHAALLELATSRGVTKGELLREIIHKHLEEKR
jgi:predicted DNA-binding protein